MKTEKLVIYILTALTISAFYLAFDFLFGWFFGAKDESTQVRVTQALLFGVLLTLWDIAFNWWKKKKK